MADDDTEQELRNGVAARSKITRLRGDDIKEVRVVEYSLGPWPTHEDGTAYTEAEAAAYGIHKVAVGDGQYVGGSALVEERVTRTDHDSWLRQTQGDWPAPVEATPEPPPGCIRCGETRGVRRMRCCVTPQFDGCPVSKAESHDEHYCEDCYLDCRAAFGLVPYDESDAG